MKSKKQLIIGVALVAAVFTGTIVAQTFYLIWIQTPFSPTNYSWEEPWEVREMLDFIQATLTLEGCGYEGQSHNAELMIKNVATTPDQYCIEFDYLCKWFVDETHQETLFAGAYSGDPMAPGDNVTYSMVWTPTVVGVGVFKMNVIDIVWVMPEPITWTMDIVNNVPAKVEVLNFVVTGASKTYAESGTASFDIHNVAAGAETISYAVEIAELSQTAGSGTGIVIPMGETQSFSHDFDPLTVAGSYTMRITMN